MRAPVRSAGVHAAALRSRSPRRVLTCLADYGLISLPDLSLRDVVLTTYSSRNPSCLVRFGSGEAYFLKHPSSSEHAVTIRREASIYAALSESADFRRLAPRLVRYDPDLPLLVLQAFAGARSSDPLLISSRSSLLRTARRLGRALALLHALPHAGVPPALTPSAYFLDLPPLGVRAHLSTATTGLVRSVQHDAALTEVIVRRREGWHPTAVIHGELKWPHCLLIPPSDDTPGSVRLVDYEFAGAGDPTWDLGCVIAAYLASWLSSMPAPVNAPAEMLLARSALSANDLQQALGAFWRAYVTRRRLPAGDRTAVLEAAVQNAVVRLLWIIFETCVAREALTDRSVLMLQLAHNLAERPHEGVRHLLGLPLG
ncbi:phosphotransferase family protein [Actinomadura scrupuli]|uniref:phosphotransferase family protein n=1 Tax=Actinomadura scrupuli TaxID=559629 RepID=UPI003D964869